MRKTLLAALLLAAIGIGFYSGSARASGAIRGLRIESAPDPGKIVLGPGGAWLFQRYLLLGITAVHTDSTLAPPFYLKASSGDTLRSGTTTRTVTFSAAIAQAMQDSLLKGGVPARTVRYNVDCGTAARTAAGECRIYGYNAAGDTISEGLTVVNGAGVQGQTTKAFARITAVKLAAGDASTGLSGSFQRIQLGRGYRIGMPFTTALDGQATTASEGNGTLFAWWKTGVAQIAPIADSIGTSATLISNCTVGLTLNSAPTTYDFLYYIPPYQGTTARTKW